MLHKIFVTQVNINGNGKIVATLSLRDNYFTIKLINNITAYETRDADSIPRAIRYSTDLRPSSELCNDY